MCPEGGEEVGAIVGQEALGARPGLDVLPGPDLVGELDQGCIAPRLLIEDGVDPNPRLDSRNAGGIGR
jgi:hypothetical protein